MAEPRGRAVDQLPLPDAWERERKSLNRWQWLGVAGVVFCFLASAVGFTARPPDLSVGLMFGFVGAILLAVSAVSFDALNAAPRRGAAIQVRSFRSSAGSMVFAPYTRVWELSFQVFTVVTIVMLLTFPLFADELASYGGASGRGGVLFFGTFGPFLAVLGLPYLFSYFIRGRRRMGIGLSPGGVYHWSWFGCVFTPWERLRYVIAIGGFGKGPMRIHLGYDEGEVPYDRSAEENWLGRFSKFRDNRWMTHVGAGHLSIHPTLMFWALTFYFEHPEHRAELGTQVAIDRFRKADFPYPGKHDPGQLPRFKA